MDQINEGRLLGDDRLDAIKRGLSLLEIARYRLRLHQPVDLGFLESSLLRLSQLVGDLEGGTAVAYSSGMAARLRFAVATATNPEVLILDEALGTGDAQFQARGKARMDEIRDNAGCVLFVSHSKIGRAHV